MGRVEQQYRDRDCIKQFEKRVLEQELMTPQQLEAVRSEIEKEMEDAVDFALSSPMPPLDELYKDVYVSYSNPVYGLR